MGRATHQLRVGSKSVSGRARRSRAVPARSSVGVHAAGEAPIVTLTGGTGFVGTKLVSLLSEEGYAVRVLTRDVEAAKAGGCAAELFSFSEVEKAVSGSHAVVNLAGEPIVQRWGDVAKRRITESRVGPTSALVRAIAALPKEERPKVLVSGSAIGFYGVGEAETEMDESTPAGGDFLAKLCLDWEGAAAPAADESGVRVVNLRIGIVLGPEGGLLGKMAPLFLLFSGGPTGDGSQIVSWIHRTDLCRLIVHAIKEEAVSGPVNATAPNPVSMSELCDALGAALIRPSWLPAPEAPIKLIFGEAATLLLEGQKVLPAKALASGFEFSFPEVTPAMEEIFPSPLREALKPLLTK